MTLSPSEPREQAVQAPPIPPDPPPPRNFHRLAPEQVVVARIAWRIAAGVCTGLASAGVVTLYFLDALRLPLLAALALLAAIACAALFAAGETWPPLEHRHAGWALDEQALHVRQGVWWRTVTSIPRARIQHTDVEQGPLQRSYDLATLVVHTAGTTRSRIPVAGMRHAEALRVRDELLEGRDRVG